MVQAGMSSLEEGKVQVAKALLADQVGKAGMVKLAPQIFVLDVKVFSFWKKIPELPLSHLHQVVAHSLQQVFHHDALLAVDGQQRAQDFLVVGKVDAFKYWWAVRVKSLGSISPPGLKAHVEPVHVVEEVKVVHVAPQETPVWTCQQSENEHLFDYQHYRKISPICN